MLLLYMFDVMTFEHHERRYAATDEFDAVEWSAGGRAILPKLLLLYLAR